MKTISIPYYTSTLDLHVDEANLKAVVTAKMHEYKAGKTEVELVHEALEHPIASPRLRDLAKGKQKVVLVTSDHTRAVPSKITLPILLDEIRQGNPDADITILIATGLHRPTTEEEQRRMFGDAIVDHEKIAINNAFDPDQFIHMGVLPSGADFNVNKLAAECDLLVTEGFIEPHFFAGFSGGFGVLLGTTGGYIIGYIPLALIEGILIEVFKDKKWTYPIWMIVGTIVLYLLGSIHFFFVNNQATTFFHILKVCVFPFIPIDLAKIVIATLLSIKLRPIVMRNLY